MTPPHFTSQPQVRWTDKQQQTQCRAILDKRTGQPCLQKTELGEVVNTETL